MARSILVRRRAAPGGAAPLSDVCPAPYTAISRSATLVRLLLRTTRETDAMTSPISGLRSELERRQVDHRPLSDTEAFHLACALRGWHVTPRTAANTAAIDARVWLAAALASGGRYRAPDADGHPADLRDDGPLVDSIVLMAGVPSPPRAARAPGWDDAALPAQLGVAPPVVARAQLVPDAVPALAPRARPPLGP